MRRVASILSILLFCAALSPAKDSAKGSAKDFFRKGVHAEALQDFEAAYSYYKQAYQLEPTNIKYRVPYQRTRFLAAASMVHRAQRLRDEGKLPEALQLFEEAAGVDPSNQLAAQEVVRTQEMMNKQSGVQASPPKKEDPLQRRLEDAQPPVRLNPISNVPLDALEYTEDAKTIYETIGKLAGINVLFDPDYTSRRVSVKLKDVNLLEALDILALESRTFWRPVTPNTIFVAQDTQAKRRELEQNAIKTFYLGNVSAPTDLQDVVNTIRTVLEVQRIQQIPSQNAIVIKATPDQLALAQKMVEDIDKGKPEVVVDVIVAQVRRDKTRNLGIVPPQTASVALQGTGTTTTTGTGTGTTTGTTTTASNPINFNSLQHLNSTNYAVTIAPVTAQFLLNDSDTRILQNPQIRATNGEKAKLTIADKIPIATGSFGTPVGVGTAVGAVGVNTQFTYTDVGVIMEITPTIHPDGQVTLKTSLEISNVSSQSTIGGITQPIISQRKIEHTIRLDDGEINLLGGILEQDYTKTTSGWPFLGQIPVLKYIFSQENKEVTTNEIIFMLIPHVVRSQQLSDLNHRALDVGTGTGIDLRIAAKVPENAGAQAASVAFPAPSSRVDPPPAPAATAVNPAVTAAPPASPAAGSPPAATSGGAANPAGNQLSLRLDPGNIAQAQGSTFALNVVLAHGQDISSVPIQIAYDPKVVEFVGVTNGDYLSKDGKTVALVHRNDPVSGRLTVSAQRPPGSAGISGDGTVFNLTFVAKAKGAGVVSISVAGARNSQNQPLVVTGSQSAVTVN